MRYLFDGPLEQVRHPQDASPAAHVAEVQAVALDDDDGEDVAPLPVRDLVPAPRPA